jgi:hypothetical protein
MSCSNDFNTGFDYTAPCKGLPLDNGFYQSGGGASCSGVGFDFSDQIGGLPAIENYAPNCIHGGYGQTGGYKKSKRPKSKRTKSKRPKSKRSNNKKKKKKQN